MRSKIAWSKVGSALLRQQILELRLTGKTVRDIASIVGKSPTRVHQILVSSLAEMNAVAADTAEQIAQIELERLDKIFDALYPMRSDPEYANALIRVMDRRAKLTGIDKPVKSAFVGKNGEIVDPPTLIVEFTDGSTTTASPEAETSEGV